MTDFAGLLQVLSRARVDFIIVGGFAGLGLQKLIEVKRAAGRMRDLQAVADLQALLEEREAEK